MFRFCGSVTKRIYINGVDLVDLMQRRLTWSLPGHGGTDVRGALIIIGFDLDMVLRIKSQDC